MAHLLPSCLCVVAAAIILWMRSSHILRRIWSMISGRNWMVMLKHGTEIQKASWPRMQASKRLNGIFKNVLTDCSNTLKPAETMLLVNLLITSQGLLQITMWLGYAIMITFWIFPLQALWPVGSVQAATPLQNSHCAHGMHWLDSCLTIRVVCGNFSGTSEGSRMGNNLEYYGVVLSLFLVFCLFYYYISHIHAWRAVMRVPDVGCYGGS